jgi:hypothetical protein
MQQRGTNMFIGVGTIVLILAVVVVFMMMRRRTV